MLTWMKEGLRLLAMVPTCTELVRSINNIECCSQAGKVENINMFLYT